jgi:hypothetical protein
MDERAKGVRNLTFDDHPTERALGIYWDIHSDTFSFNISLKSSTPTRRNVLSTVCSLYDPLGFVSPFILQAKILLQELCEKNEGWDKQLAQPELKRWQQWLSDVPKLDGLKVPRCMRPDDFGKVVCTQLHYFTDASEKGYGVVCFIRFTNTSGEVHCQLLISKARVAPIKKISIPRLELTAATMAVKLHRRMQDELDIIADSVLFWTDSMSVLRYIANHKTRFHTFVANRLVIIHEGSCLEQWRYVDSQSNPADVVSRGISVDGLLRAEWWMKGPEFLRKPFTTWVHDAMTDDMLHIQNDDREVKMSVHAAQVSPTEYDHPLNRLAQRCSTWLKIQRVTARILCFIQMLKDRRQLCTPTRSQTTIIKKVLPLEKSHLDEAEKLLLQHVQRTHFQDEFKLLEDGRSDRCIQKQSSLARLNPFIGKDKLLRVGGRLSESTLSYDAQHPVILPRDAVVSRLIIEKIHRDVGHFGRNSIMSHMRQRYWVIGASSTIRRILSKCVICRKYKAQTMNQLMAELPSDRLTPDEAPFVRSGVDYFGPFIVKRGRSTAKRYGVIFTCLTSRAVHLEISYALDTDSCINAVSSKRSSEDSILRQRD